MVAAATYTLTLPGPMLHRGFWLYVWRVEVPDGRELLYVGRTGDNSSPNAAPAYIRMGQHLGQAKNTNALRKHLTNRGIAPEDCGKFDLISHGPIYPEVDKPTNYRHDDKETRAALMELHLPIRDKVGAMEKRLADDLNAAGYDVMNIVKWKPEISDEEWRPIRDAFSDMLPKLGELT